MASVEDDWGDEEELPEGPGLELSLQAAPSQDVGPEGGDHMVVVSIGVPECNKVEELTRTPCGNPVLNRTKSGRVTRAPTDVCCVVDISGSMGQRATYEAEDGSTKDDGLTYLDIVKHAVKTVMHILKDDDRMALVAFDNKAQLAFPLDYMTADGRTRAVETLEALRPQGQTDIWKGIHTGMEALRLPEKDAGWRQKTVLLLTDGQPNVVPPRGHIPELRDYKESHPDFSFMINTFGFGYNLDSDLLLDLAVEGQGTYGFIPDALIVGTAFVNCIANVLSTQTQKAQIHLMTQGGAEFTGPVLGIRENMVVDASWGRVVSLGPLQFGGARQVAVPIRIPPGEGPYFEAVLSYPGDHGKEHRASVTTSTRTATEFAVAGHARSDTVAAGYEAVNLGVSKQEAKAQETMSALAGRVAGQEASGGEFVKALKVDVEGRMTKALNGADRFNRWGKHYLRSISRAHQVQCCTNFMDTGLQGYGGALFRALREEGDKVFVSLPAPKKSAPKSHTSTASTGGGSRARTPSPDMNTYYAGSGGG